MSKLSVGDEVVIVSGEDAGETGMISAITHLSGYAKVDWDRGSSSWVALSILDELVDDSASGLVALSRAEYGAVHARYSRSLEEALLHRSFECHSAGTCNDGRSIRLRGEDWTVILHATQSFAYRGVAL